jgi:hypothetical protein
MTTDNAPNEFWFACGRYRSPDGMERISRHCNTRVALRDALDALKDMADAAVPFVTDDPVPTSNCVRLYYARVRALKVLEEAP